MIKIYNRVDLYESWEDFRSWKRTAYLNSQLGRFEEPLFPQEDIMFGNSFANWVLPDTGCI